MWSLWTNIYDYYEISSALSHDHIIHHFNHLVYRQLMRASCILLYWVLHSRLICLSICLYLWFMGIKQKTSCCSLYHFISCCYACRTVQRNYRNVCRVSCRISLARLWNRHFWVYLNMDLSLIPKIMVQNNTLWICKKNKIQIQKLFQKVFNTI